MFLADLILNLLILFHSKNDFYQMKEDQQHYAIGLKTKIDAGLEENYQWSTSGRLTNYTANRPRVLGIVNGPFQKISPLSWPICITMFYFQYTIHITWFTSTLFYYWYFKFLQSIIIPFHYYCPFSMIYVRAFNPLYLFYVLTTPPPYPLHNGHCNSQ